MLRLANRNDLKDCLRMAKSFHEQSPYKDRKFSEDKCTEIFNKYLEDGGLNLIFILACDPDPFGMIIGVKGDLPFSDTVVCTELAWWVDADKRGSRDSLLLFSAYEDWCKRLNADLSAVAMLEGVTDLSGFYEKRKYHPAEKTYFKEL
jgi:hypothetical protein